MTQKNHSNSDEAEMSHPTQSKSTLLKASFLAALLAALALVFAILPAEYGIDPSGIGQRLGLTKLSAADTDGEIATGSPVASDSLKGSVYQEDSVTIDIPAGKSLEYKFHLRESGAMKYNWTASGGELFFDFHGEPSGDTSGYFESYVISTAKAARGTFTAPFTGSHGWYWKNKSENPVVISLKTGGNYEVIGVK